MGNRNVRFMTFGKTLCAFGIIGYIAVDSGAIEWMRAKDSKEEIPAGSVPTRKYADRLSAAASKIRAELENAKRLRKEVADMGQRLREQEKSFERLATEIRAARNVAGASPVSTVTRDLESLARALASDSGAPVKFEPIRHATRKFVRLDTSFTFDDRRPEYMRPRGLRRLARLSAGAARLGFEEIHIAHRPSEIAIDRAEGVRRYLTEDLGTSLKVSRLLLNTPDELAPSRDFEVWLGKGDSQ